MFKSNFRFVVSANLLVQLVIRKMQKSINLNVSGLQMPTVGLGTWKSTPDEIERVINIALECGYRHIDTAFNYYNEQAIGDALKKWLDSGKIKRNELFITTKLPSLGNRASDVERFLKLSLKNLKLDYLDLYLIHSPFAFACDDETLQPAKTENGLIQLDHDNDNFATWKVMEEQVRKGLIKAIGISNFNVEQTKAIFDKAKIKPAVLQIELHAYLQQRELLELCKELGIVVTAYSPLGSPGAQKHFIEKYNYKIEQFFDLLHDPVIVDLAEKYGKTTGQILLKFLLQKGITVIPKSANPQRIKQNLELFDFEIKGEDVAKLDALDKGEKGRIFTFLHIKGLEKHPHYPF